MKQYEKDGFKKIRKLDYSKLNGKVNMPTINNDILKLMMNDSSVAQVEQQQSLFSYTPLMINSEGYEYIGNEIVYNMDDSIETKAPLRSVPGYKPNNENVRNRILTVLGTDTRTQIKNTQDYPYSSFGALGYNPDNLICSGTVVYKSAILTAAHCLYNADTRQYAQTAYFAPGRGKDGIDFNDPFGRWPVDKILIPSTYRNKQNWGADFAIVRLKPNSQGQEIGDVVGYVGIDEVSGYADPDLDESTLTGYPFDKGGRTMWTSGKCPSGFVSGSAFRFDSRVALHDCDTTGGTSGSSITRLSDISNGDYAARGVHVLATLNTTTFPWNGANVFFQGNGIYDTVVAWSGRTPSPAPAPTVCFSGNNLVDVKNVGKIPIHELKIGDYVKGRNDKFTRVYSFGHKSYDHESQFVQIYFDDDNDTNLPLEISATHFLFVNSVQSHEALSSYNPPVIKTASEVMVGDILSGKKVTSIRSVTRTGVFAPLTETGDIYVSNILASNYVRLIDSPWMLWIQHFLGHIIWFPQRLFCHYMMNVCMEETYTNDGYSLYASWIIYMSNIIYQLGWMASLTLSFCCVPIVTVVYMLESMTTKVFWLSFFAIVAVGIMRKKIRCAWEHGNTLTFARL